MAGIAIAMTACAGAGAEQPPVDQTVVPTVSTAETAPTVTVASVAPTVQPVATDVYETAGPPGIDQLTPAASPVATAPPTTVTVTAAPQPTVMPTLPKQDPTPWPTATAMPVPSPTATPAPPTPTPVAPLPRTTQFVPLDDPVFVPAANAPARVTPDSFVLGLDWNGEVRAYPLDMMWWHHIVNDTIGSDPVLVTY